MKNTTIQLLPATSGTKSAINSPPLLITPQIQEGLINKTEDPIAKADRDRVLLGMPEYTWKTCSRKARMVLEHMRRCTPKGAKPPWRSSPSVTPIQRLLDEGCPMEDLMELVEGAAAMIASGRQSARWYYPSNLFGPKTLERWLADLAVFEAECEAADAQQQELEAIDERLLAEKEASRVGASPAITDLGLRRVAADLLATVRERAKPVIASENGDGEMGTNRNATRAQGAKAS